MHMPKTGNTTILNNIKSNFDKNKFIDSYSPLIRQQLKSMSKEQKNEIRLIIGHTAYYGIHKFFPDREPRYIIFLRKPVKRTLSHYNFQRMWFAQKRNRFEGMLLQGNKVLDFKNWFLKNPVFQNFMCKFLFVHFFEKDLRIRNVSFDRKKFNDVKRILNKFYFIGLTENPEDFLFIYSLLGVERFFPNQNISKKYFIPKNYKDNKEFILNKCQYDKELYEYARELNAKFKSEHKNFNIITYYIGIKRFFTCEYCALMKRLYYISAKLRRKSKGYSKVLDFVKKNGK